MTEEERPLDGEPLEARPSSGRHAADGSAVVNPDAGGHDDVRQTSAGAGTTAVTVESPQRSGWTFLRDVVVILVVALLISTLLKTYVVRTFYIPSGSMEPTLQVGDRVLVNRLSPKPFALERGDVVVFSDPGGWLSTPPGTQSGFGSFVQSALTLVGLSDSDSHQYLVKRIIALGGDHVVCAAVGEPITVNGVAVDESAYTQPGSTPCVRTFDVTVGSDAMWVMGDNRGNSRDSSFHTSDPGQGTVPVSNVVGRAFQITWPLNRFSTVDSHTDVFADVPQP